MFLYVVTNTNCLNASLTVYQKSYQVLLACSAILGPLIRFTHYYFFIIQGDIL